MYLALKNLITQNNLDAISIRCFDLLAEKNTTACLALALLNDESVIAGCEGDLPSLLGLLWAHKVTGQVPWMANPALVDPQANSVTLAHCSVPTCLTRSHALTTHFESGRGVAIRGKMEAGPATVLRIGGKKLDQLWIAEGTIEPGTFSRQHCRTQAKIKLNTQKPLQELLSRPLGNHIVMLPGHHLDMLKQWHQKFISTSIQ